MNYESDEKIIKHSLNTIQTPEYDIMLAVEKKIKSPKYSIGFKRAISIPLVVCFCFMIFGVAMAATIPSFNKILSVVSPSIALLLQPVERSCENNGIKMEVVGAVNDDEMVVIYVTMQDLMGDRIDETLDIYDYSLTGLHTFNCQMVNYDKTTKTAILRIEANGGKKLNGKKIRFSISSFLSDKQIFDEVETGINLLDIETTNPLQMVSLDMNKTSGGGNLYKQFKEQGAINILKADQMNIALPKIDFMHISNIGYIDGRLHIQAKWDGHGVDDHGYFYFVDTLGNTVDIKQSNIYFGADESSNIKYGNDYVEYIFDVDNIDINDVKLMGYFVSNGKYTKGNWKNTFKIQSVGEKKQTDCNIEFDNWIANSISVTPMGITLVGRGQYNNLQKITVGANMTDGSTQTFESMRSYIDKGEIKLKFTSSLSLNVSNVRSVTVGEATINFN